MTSAAGPREVFDQLIRSIAAMELEDLPDLYAEDAVVEHVFGMREPKRWSGVDEIRTHFQRPAADLTPRELRDVVVHETTDPEVVVGEWTYVWPGPDGNPIEMANIVVMRVRDGLIVESRDYHNHWASAIAAGRLPGQAEARGASAAAAVAES